MKKYPKPEEDRSAWAEACTKGYRKPESMVRTIVSLPPSIPDEAPHLLEEWQVRFWQKLFEHMSWDEQREFLQSKGDAESKKAFLMRHGAKGLIE